VTVRSPTTGRVARVLLIATLGVGAALLASACSSSSKGLIPTSNAGPLQSDFEAVARAAESGDGDCTATESALLKTEQDFAKLPSSVDAGLRDTLTRGIENLRSRSLALCVQPLPQATTTQTTASTPTTPPSTETQATSTPTTPPPTTTTTTPGSSAPGGGTQAPGEETHVGEVEGGVSPGGGEGAGGSGGARAGGNGDDFDRLNRVGHGRHGGFGARDDADRGDGR
jgi:hypothetical protein